MNILRLATWLHEAQTSVWLLAPEGSPTAQEARQFPDLPFAHFASSQKYFNLRAAYRLAKGLKKKEVKVLLLAQSKDLYLAALAKRLFYPALKLVYLQQMWLGGKKRDLLHSLVYGQLSAWIAPLGVIAESVRQKTRLDSAKIHLIPLCFDTARFVPEEEAKTKARQVLQLPPDVFLAGLVGRIDPGKGQEYLIEALALLRQEGLPIEILLLGEETKGEEGRYLPYLQKQVQQEGLEPFVHFRPFTRQIAQAYASLDVFCMTSKAETFGMVTVEAMASGLPVIGTASGGTPELIQSEETGILIPPQDAMALAQAIAYLYQNPEKARLLGQKAQASVQARFHYRVQVEKIQALWQKLMEKP
ncbi:MAG: hypothetical protein OHK0053_11760 [Microscillaceae bacterium]